MKKYDPARVFTKADARDGPRHVGGRIHAVELRIEKEIFG
jgi:hypothetical protein